MIFTTRAKSTATTAVMSAMLNQSGRDEVVVGQALVQHHEELLDAGQAALRLGRRALFPLSRQQLHWKPSMTKCWPVMNIGSLVAR